MELVEVCLSWSDIMVIIKDEHENDFTYESLSYYLRLSLRALDSTNADAKNCS